MTSLPAMILGGFRRRFFEWNLVHFNEVFLSRAISVSGPREPPKSEGPVPDSPLNEERRDKVTVARA